MSITKRRVFPLIAGALLAAPAWCQQAATASTPTAALLDSPKITAAAASTLAAQELRVQTTPSLKPVLVAYMAMLALKAGDLTKAELYAQEALADSAQAGPNQGTQVFYGNEALGLIAVRQGNLELAKYYLLQSGQTKGSPALKQFGPNMLLAKSLFDLGQHETVLEFIGLCKAFWPSGANTLLQWSGAINAGAAPDFGVLHLTMTP